MPNVQNIISSHNKTILRKEANRNNVTERNCNCRAKDACPLQGECQTKAVTYQAAVTNKATKEVQKPTLALLRTLSKPATLTTPAPSITKPRETQPN